MLHFPRRTQKPPLLGVDINSSAICISALIDSPQGFSIRACARTALPADRLNHEPELIEAVLKQTLAATNLKAGSAAIAIDHSLALFKTLEVDGSLTEDEILSYIRHRAGQYFNQPLEETLLDFEILGPSKNNPDLVVVRWIAAKKHSIAMHIQNLKRAGVTTAIVDINSYALQRAANYCHTQSTTAAQTLAVVYINGESILLTVSDHEIPIYTLSEHNKSLVNLNNSEVTKMVSTFILRALQQYYNSELHKPVSLISLCGNITHPALTAAIQQQTQITTELAAPFAYLELTKNLHPTLFGKLQSISEESDNISVQYPAHEFMLSIGLAMRIRNTQPPSAV